MFSQRKRIGLKTAPSIWAPKVLFYKDFHDQRIRWKKRVEILVTNTKNTGSIYKVEKGIKTMILTNLPEQNPLYLIID